MSRTRPIAPLLVLLVAVAFAGFAFASSRPVMTSRDAVQTVRFMTTGAGDSDFVSLSPTKARYVVRLAKGDLERNGVWVDILTGTVGEHGAASRPQTVARLFSTGRGVHTNAGPEGDASGIASPLKWLNNDAVAFLFSDAAEVRQVVVVNLVSGEVEFKTHHPTQIRAFDIALDGTMVFLAASGDAAANTREVTELGYVVPEGADAVSIAEGHFNGASIFSRAWDSEWFTQRAGEQAKRIAFGSRVVDRGFPNLRAVSIAPNGKHAIVLAPADIIPTEWYRYIEPETEGRSGKSKLDRARRDPSGLAARDIMMFYVVDVEKAEARPLWNAIGPSADVKVAWSPDSIHAALAPTPVPIGDESGKVTLANTVVVDISLGKHWVISADGDTVKDFDWLDSASLSLFAENAGGTVRQDFAFSGKEWSLERTSTAHERATYPRVEQQLNVPPRLMARDLRGSKQVLFDPNPQLTDRFKLGRVEYLSGALSTGERWTATMTLPVDYRPAKRYPLVIQGQGGAVPRDQFTLYGSTDDSGLGPCHIAAYAAQMLAGRNIAVLQLAVEAKYGSPAEVDTVRRAYQEVAEQQIRSGAVARERIGIAGFSRNGYFTYQALSAQSLPFAAAVVVDNFDPSYLQTTLLNTYEDAEEAIGAPPFGEGLRIWLDRATGFNVDKIVAPVLLIGQSGGARTNILWQWEVLGRLRHLKRPVEMYLMPKIDTHPSHSMQNPAQIIAVQERVVDWFDFWLNDHEAEDARKREQYEGWRRLKELKDFAKPMGQRRAPQ